MVPENESESKNEKEVEAKLANVAMHLGMIEEAKNLLRECNRWDVLIHFYISNLQILDSLILLPSYH